MNCEMSTSVTYTRPYDFFHFGYRLFSISCRCVETLWFKSYFQLVELPCVAQMYDIAYGIHFLCFFCFVFLFYIESVDVN